ncbi:uncharacterized protein MYCFIDRAFT_85530 [Pseudocercospora fijiensis CIRAD86]|uniref:Uncharacterized protein n=1 Tax=Pseudocercospora fijiensis (strain CIRAD86) TaxID=383855 RepID=N1QBH2_PSEFD|nr:uncharacterized protein MYCFIDRAFT_85530 [Pseudocercospora fijiensis CIRAD86]EME88493.1 hypothetical protein MYCFIDRAFT_85530 [Pseudocercospora fijiensis CIRAD86]
MAVEMDTPSTPPRRTRAHLHVPPTPLHGSFLDSPPRRSTRSTLNTNPYSSANVSASSSFKSSANSSLPPVTPNIAGRKLSFAVSDALSTPPASPMQPRLGAISAHADNGLDDDNRNAQGDHKTLAAPSSNKSAMLPTPSKTPSMTPARKRQRAASLQDTARVLHFQPENPNDAMPTPQQSRKHKAALASKTGAFDLDANKPKRKGNDFTIYTETQARVPEVDKSSGNVFRGRATSSAPPAHERARQWDSSPSPPPRSRRSAQDLYDEQRMDSAAKQEQGIVYTFRGRKVYKKFEDVDGPDLGESSRQRALKRAAGDTRPITRSNITPRLLWARQNNDRDIDEGGYIRQHDTADEEAETDIDMSDAPIINIQEVDPSVPAQHTTPAKTKARSKPFMSPPTTSRTTRTKQHEDIPSFDETLDADDEGAAAVLPTPQRSSRKKKVAINDIPVYQEGTPEPMSMTPDGKDAPPAPTPARARTKRVQTQLTPVIEDEEPASAECSRSPAAGRRKACSPFDNWPRTKAGRKREAVEDASSAAPSKRSRSGTRSARA